MVVNMVFFIFINRNNI